MSFANKGYWREVDIDDPINGGSLGSANVIVCTIGPADGKDNYGNAFDYNTLNAWREDFTNYNPVDGKHTARNGNTADITGAPFWAECYGGVNLLSNGLMINAGYFTPTSTHFVRIYAADGHRANGLFDPRGFYSSANVPQGAFAEVSDTTGIVLAGLDYVRLEGLRLMVTDGFAAQVDESSDYAVVQGNTVQVTATSTTGFQPNGILYMFIGGVSLPGDAERTVIMRNNAVYGDGSGKEVSALGAIITSVYADQDLTLEMYLENNTVVNCGGEEAGQIQGAFHNMLDCKTASGSIVLKSHMRNNLCLKPPLAHACYATSFLTNPLNITVECLTHEANMSNDDTADDCGTDTSAGINNYNNVTPADVVYNAATDARLRRNSPAVGAGENLSAIFTTDLRGRTRRTWDIGALAYCPIHHAATNPTPSSAPAVIL